jgi:hypothetical protein
MNAVYQPPLPLNRAVRLDPSLVLRLVNYFSANHPTAAESLFDNAELLFSRLTTQGIPHVLVGGLALLMHSEGRNTEDVDLIMALPDVAQLPEFTMEDKNEWFGRGKFGELQVDLLFTANPVFALVEKMFTEKKSFRGHSLQVATPEGLLILKLYALPSLYRQGQTGRASIYESDIALLLIVNPVSDEQLLQKLTPHMMESDITALREVLLDVRSRLARKF